MRDSAAMNATIAEPSPPERPASSPATATCRHCGYALTGLREPSCPECATPFDPADPSSYCFVRPPVPWIERRSLVPLIVMGVVGAGCVVCYCFATLDLFRAWVMGPLLVVEMVWPPGPHSPPRLVIGALSAAAGMLALIVTHPIRPNRRTLRRSVIGLLLWFGSLPLMAAVFIIRRHWPW